MSQAPQLTLETVVAADIPTALAFAAHLVEPFAALAVALPVTIAAVTATTVASRNLSAA